MLGPQWAAILGSFSSRRRARSHHDHKTGGSERAGFRIPGRSCWCRAEPAGVWRWRRRTSRRAPIHQHLRGKSSHLRRSHGGRWGRSSPGKTARKGHRRSEGPRRERRTGSLVGIPPGTQGSSGRGALRRPRPEPRPLRARPRTDDCSAQRTSDPLPIGGVGGRTAAQGAHPPESQKQQATKPSLELCRI